MREFTRNIFFPSLFHSLFNSFFVTIFINSVVFLKKQKNFKIIAYLFPIIFTTLIVFSVLFFVKIDNKKINLTRIDDARLFFTSNSFFEYDYILNQKFEENEFERDIIDKIDNIEDKIFFSKLYYKDINSSKYYLKNNISDNNRERAENVLFSINYFKKIKLYFEGIKRDLIEKAIVIDENGINFYNNIKVEFIEDRYYILLPDRKLEFFKIELFEYNIYESSIIKFVFDRAGKITYIFSEYKNPFISTLLYLALVFLLQSIISLINFKQYQLLSFIINFLILLILIAFTYDFIIFITNILTLVMTNNILIPVIFISAFIIAGLFINMINFLFFKNNIWERE